MSKFSSALLDQEQCLTPRIFKPGGEVRSNVAQVIQPPWVTIPDNGTPFDTVQSIVCPANDGADHEIGNFQVATGHEGILLGIGNLYFGTGFLEGSGGIAWRISINGLYVRSYEAIVTSLGSLSQARPVAGGWRLHSGDIVSYLVNIPVASPVATGAGNFVIGMLAGWTWPGLDSGAY